MRDVEVLLDDVSGLHRVGVMRRHAGRGRESVTFAYDEAWLRSGDAFAVDPALPLLPGTFAHAAGINVADHALHCVAGKPVLVSRRFDRLGTERVAFMSAMAMTQHVDGERGSYLELVDALAEHGAIPREDKIELFRRMVFSVLVRNVDDHLRNRGFLRFSQAGWQLSPAYDINPVPQDVKAGVLATNIDLDDGTCSIALLRSVAEAFSLSMAAADGVIVDIARVCREWRQFAVARGADRHEIDRMASAFEHPCLDQALSL